MRKTLITLVASGLMVGLLSLGCETASQKVVENEREVIITSHSEMTEGILKDRPDLEKYKSEIEQEIENNQEKIGEIKSTMIETGPLAIKRYASNMHLLQHQNRDLRKALEEFPAGERNE
jgi:hypothetical protein